MKILIQKIKFDQIFFILFEFQSLHSPGWIQLYHKFMSLIGRHVESKALILSIFKKPSIWRCKINIRLGKERLCKLKKLALGINFGYTHVIIPRSPLVISWRGTSIVWRITGVTEATLLVETVLCVTILYREGLCNVQLTEWIFWIGHAPNSKEI